jgi:hypothetical protein
MIIERQGQSIRTIDEWERIAPPKSSDQWRPGRSAFECANAWCGTGMPIIPEEIRTLLDSHTDIARCSIVSATPEHQVRFDRVRGEARNTDLAVLATNQRGNIAISIEAKADEPFGEYIGNALADAFDRNTHGYPTGLPERIRGLLSLLPPRLARAEKAGTIRYQLLTALAGALAFARANGSVAVLVVHEFQTAQTERKRICRNQTDLDRFIRRLSSGTAKNLDSGILLGPFPVVFAEDNEPTPVYLGKATRVIP